MLGTRGEIRMGQQAFWWSFLVVFALSACSDEGGTSDDTAGALDTDRGVMMDIDADLVPDTSPQPDQGPIPDAAIDGERVPRI